jgi:hypothetical protein
MSVDLFGPRDPQPCSEGCGKAVLFAGPCAECQEKAKKTRIFKRSVAKIASEGRCINCGGPRGDSGTAHRCRPCQEKVSVRTAKCQLRTTYRLTPEEAEEIRNSPCFICGSTPSVIDHCHETGTVREPLCSSCNRAFGMLKEDPERISKLVVYAFRALAIRKHHAEKKTSAA